MLRMVRTKMTLQQINKLICSDAYSFLRTNPHLKDRVIMLAIGGSHAYGTNVDSSDLDVRGCALNSATDILGLSSFEQVVSNETDTTVYSFNKLIPLLLNCNPNTIEILGCKPEHYLHLSPIGKELIDNRKMFLSQRALKSFGGYATQQLRRLENALTHDKNIPEEQRQRHILNALGRAFDSFSETHIKTKGGNVDLSFSDSDEHELIANINLKNYPVKEFDSLLNTLAPIAKTYDKLNHRNRKKDNNHLNKHAMHLVRLYLMCLDILEKEEIITYRENDKELLLSIRSGAFQKEDGTYREEFFDMINDFKNKIKYASENTSLPVHPDMKQVEDFVMSVNERSLFPSFLRMRDMTKEEAAAHLELYRSMSTTLTVGVFND